MSDVAHHCSYSLNWNLRELLISPNPRAFTPRLVESIALRIVCFRSRVALSPGHCVLYRHLWLFLQGVRVSTPCANFIGIHNFNFSVNFGEQKSTFWSWGTQELELGRVNYEGFITREGINSQYSLPFLFKLKPIFFSDQMNIKIVPAACWKWN